MVMNMQTTPTLPATEANRYHLWYLLAVALAMVLLFWSLATEDPWGWLFPRQVPVLFDEQVYLVPERELERLAWTRPDWLPLAEEQALARLEQGVGEELDALFAQVHERVPAFANWYYSAPGLGVRFVAAMPWEDGDSLAEAVTGRLFPPERWAEELAALDRAVAARHDAEFAAIEQRWLAWLADELAPYRQDRPLAGERPALDLDRRLQGQLGLVLDADRIVPAMGAGLVASSLLARQAIVRVNARAASARAAVRLASRGTAASGSTLCAATGPVAIGCAVATFTTITVATEWGLLQADEALNRPALEAALHGSVDALRQSMMDDYGRQFLAVFEANLNTYAAGINRSLRPIDRLRP